MTTTDPVAISDVDLLDLDAFVDGRHHAMFATLREQDPVHFHAEPDGPVPTYLDLIRHDSKVILEALTGKTS